jgi:hypothetical protein
VSFVDDDDLISQVDSKRLPGGFLEEEVVRKRDELQGKLLGKDAGLK